MIKRREKKKEKRMASFLLRSSKLCQGGKIDDGMRMMSDGVNYYSNEVISAISPYAVADAGIIVAVLRHIADEMEVKNEGSKELATYLMEHMEAPVLKERTKVRKPNVG